MATQWLGLGDSMGFAAFGFNGKKSEIRGIQWILMGGLWSYTYLQHVITN